MSIPSLLGSYIDETYQRLIQTDGIEFADGLGNPITFGQTPTGSFATTASNDFKGSQTVTGSLNISQNLIVMGSASFYSFTTIYETSSIIYSSGSNQFGDNTDDVQSLYGTVLVSGSQQITGSLDVSGYISAFIDCGEY